MRYNPAIHHRRSIRLKGYDYSRNGAYYITLCTENRDCLFGSIVAGEMRLSEAGGLVDAAWHDLVNHNVQIRLDCYVIMPNHFHGIIMIGMDTDDGRMRRFPGDFGMISGLTGVTGGFGVGAGSEPAPTTAPWVITAPKTLAATTSHQKLVDPTPSGREHGLSEIVRQLKTFSARRINELRHTSGVAVWQRNYYEHIIRDNAELERIRKYIRNNPWQWDRDRNNPLRKNER